MGKTRLLAILFSVLSLILMRYDSVEGFDDNAHTLLSRRAVGASKLDGFLKSQLPEFLTGIEESIEGRTVTEHIEDGSINEDRPLPRRVQEHFHDPTKIWNEAGLTGFLGVRSGISSVIWGQTANQDNGVGGGNHSWQDARDDYLNALTQQSDTNRKSSYTSMFRSLGHLVHLIQDAATPAHTRNDWHLSYRGWGDPDYFHQWADSLRLGGLSAIAGSGVTPFDLSILGLPQNGDAPIPIARIIDTEKYRTDTIPRASTDIGIAEYSHANFFSDDTVVSNYTNPNRNSVDPCIQNGRVYLCKNREGETGYKLAVASSLSNFLATGFQSAEIDRDNAIMQDYGRLLFPRAIGYSAGLIDYFFRGKIEIEAPDRFVYALAKYETGNTGSFKKLRFKVSNDTNYPSATEDTVGSGQMWAVVRYRKPLSGDLIENPFANLSEPFYAVSLPQSVSLSRTPQELTFDFTGSPIPTNSADVSLTAVWQGKLGLEDGALLVGGKNLFEPDPYDPGNATDYDCYRDQIYTVTNPSILTADRDVNDDGIQDLFGPVTETNVYVKIYDPSGIVPTPSSTNFDFKLSQTRYAQEGRFVMLQDQPSFGVVSLIDRTEDDFTHSVTFSDQFIHTFSAVRNEYALGPGGVTRFVTPSFFYRGVPMLHGAVRLSSLTMFNSPACLSQLSVAQPNMTRIEGTLPAE